MRVSIKVLRRSDQSLLGERVMEVPDGARHVRKTRLSELILKVFRKTGERKITYKVDEAE
jgi:hypothetical protein